ncbi:hypothetical protein PYW08_000201 [Mythimna loreyi]|uniref:Uncharacterized protein n=1 Tax=Mythimna loreyi TaxID=667449 RepID=A0ACC2RAS4_9NEOP|nr:hypothetical protein PYW08_000201 [Mythimna loreyi]
MNARKCCVVQCTRSRPDTILHLFPDPEKELDRFNKWIFTIGGNALVLDPKSVYKNGRICHAHFEPKYYTSSSRLSKIAVPSLQLSGVRLVPPLSAQPATDSTVQALTHAPTLLTLAETNPPVQTDMTDTHMLSKPQSVPSTTAYQSIVRKIDIVNNPTTDTNRVQLSSQGNVLRELDRQRANNEVKIHYTSESVNPAMSMREILIPAGRVLPVTFKPRTEPSCSEAGKRDRSDDPAAPSALQLFPKRMRLQAAQEAQKKYKLVTQDIPARFAVTICFPPPSRDLTSDEVTYVKSELDRLILEAEPTKPLPAFCGYPRVIDGTLQMWCEDDNALTWLRQAIPLLRLPNTTRTLTVMRKYAPTRVRASLFVPRYNGDIAWLQSVLIRQNTWYDIERWSLNRAITFAGDKIGTYLTLDIPIDEVYKVLGRERRVSYLLGSIYVRFYSEAQRSDVKTDSKRSTEQTQPEMNTNKDLDIEEMADDDTDIARASPRLPAQPLASSPSDAWSKMDEVVTLSDELDSS